MSRLITWRRLVLAAGAAGVGVLGGMEYVPKYLEGRQMKYLLEYRPLSEPEKTAFFSPLPTREEMVKSLDEKEYDVLIVGGGATGCGVALDAVTRGLSVALVEKYDFSSGTSSRSTKLIHGGVRYLQKAIFNLDLEQYRMVQEALRERSNLVDIAPHLAQPIPIMLPLYSYWKIPYYWVGIKMYDVVSGSRILRASYYLNKSRALELFPMLDKDELKGALVYYDGQQNDARMNLSLAITAARLNATVTNYTEVTSLSHNEEGRVCGATVRDRITGKEYQVKAKCVVNATGPYTDTLRKLDNQEVRTICAPSAGVHIVLPGYYSPANMGLLDPATKDGRVIFFLPWEGSTMAGTTDKACALTDSPGPSEEDVQFILGEIRHYLAGDVQVRRGDVLSAWAGIRPLVMDPSKKDTQSIARNHIIEVSPSGMVTIAGGKWTTYRHMAEETVDAVIKEHHLPTQRPCVTEGFRLEGGHTYTPTLHIQLSQDFGLEPLVAQHLAHTYGDRAKEVAQLAALTGKRWPVIGKRLHPDYPYIEAEVVYACREYARSVVDILARRTRLAFLNVHAAEEVIPRVVELMAKELGWDRRKQEEETKHAKEFLVKEMGLDLKKHFAKVKIKFTQSEIASLVKLFQRIDLEKKGFITVVDLKNHAKQLGEDYLTDEQLRDILNEVDLNRNGEIDLDEFLQFMSALKTGAVSDSRFHQFLSRIALTSVERSGGGL